MSSLSTLLGKPKRLSVTIGKPRPSLAELLREDNAPRPAAPAASPSQPRALPAAPSSSPLPERTVPAFLLGRAASGVDYLWSPSLEANPHLAILGSSGTGKTELLRVLAHEFSLADLPTIAIDLHGELTFPRLRRYNIGAGASLDPVALAVEISTSRREANLRDVLGSTTRALGSIQEAALHGILGERAESLRSLADLRRAVAEKVAEVPNLRNVETLFEQLGRELSDGTPIRLADLLRSGGVVDLHALSHNARDAAARALLSAIWASARSQPPVRQPGALRLAILLDEAELLRNLSALDTLPREARKFGISLTVATQMAKDLPLGLRANVASLAVFRLADAAAARQAAQLLPGITANRIAELEAPGWALFRGRSGIELVHVRPLAERRALKLTGKKP